MLKGTPVDMGPPSYDPWPDVPGPDSYKHIRSCDYCRGGGQLATCEAYQAIKRDFERIARQRRKELQP